MMLMINRDGTHLSEIIVIIFDFNGVPIPLEPQAQFKRAFFPRTGRGAEQLQTKFKS
jgi:hypothetical protein